MKERMNVLLLSNNENSAALACALTKRGETLTRISDPLSADMLCAVHPKIIVSYNYAHIIKPQIIQLADVPVINLHTSLLPWNRGANPNFWSFADNTPKGVTIHLIDSGLDTGDILFQKELFFDVDTETFVTTYQKLNDAVTALLLENWDTLISGNFERKKQVGTGSYHTKKQFIDMTAGMDFCYDMLISEFLHTLTLQ